MDGETMEVDATASGDRATRRLLRNPGTLVAIVFLGVVVLGGLLGPWLSPWSVTKTDLTAALQRPSSSHWLGTDQLGRDLLTRILAGGRIALTVVVTGMLAASLVGMTLGILAGYFRGVVDAIIGRLIDILMAFPTALLAIGVVAALGPSVSTVIVALALVSIPEFARVVRASVIEVSSREYLMAAKGLGFSHARIILRHCLPNITSPAVVVASGIAARMLLAESILSFLGVGVQPPTPSWGSMVDESTAFIFAAPYLVIAPGAVLTLTALALNFLGDGLRDVFDVEMR
jgi:peptide/nickel transport system permease protein